MLFFASVLPKLVWMNKVSTYYTFFFLIIIWLNEWVDRRMGEFRLRTSSLVSFFPSDIGLGLRRLPGTRKDVHSFQELFTNQSRLPPPNPITHHLLACIRALWAASLPSSPCALAFWSVIHLDFDSALDSPSQIWQTGFESNLKLAYQPLHYLNSGLGLN